MLSYNNDANLKSLMISEMKKHQAQDQFIKGCYGKTDESGEFKGCSVGCTIHSVNKILGKSYQPNDHLALTESIGIPEELAYLQDELFEALPDEQGPQFSVDFLSAIPVGVNLDPIKHKFFAFLMRECIDIVTALPDLSDEFRKKILKSIADALELHEAAIDTGVWDTGTAAVWDRGAAAVALEASEASEAAERARGSMAAARWAMFGSETISSLPETIRRVVWSRLKAIPSSEEGVLSKEEPYKKYANELITLLQEHGK